ncbi:hypothetical protein FEM48_Zijuj10G0003000 [Ziziphus jujuba var. spinosa]|uniref:Transferase n=1 Tax=Ziziphus jujuba var. spinosa TaxID=714518 RepID=A0A978UK59_ZIZJJ|nr:protein ENHANCED PSEUDOMONAS SUSCEPTIBILITY 1-like [Ziziphus jujuba var. spinosa]KAH7515211.1 hypothetical protein FEM48_Zijuj10G0003000 [Ziziphus jujuba var. spinosa]
MEFINNNTTSIVSECFVQPHQYHHHACADSDERPPKHNSPFYLTPWDLYFINSQNHTQKGLLFAKPCESDQFMIDSLLDRLKHSLSLTLTHFCPLAGRIRTIQHENENGNESPVSYCSFYVDCKDSPGVKFIHATSDLTISDIISPPDDIVPRSAIRKFFHDDRELVDLHEKSLVTITIFQQALHHHHQHQPSTVDISRPPVLNPWFPDGQGPLMKVPFNYENQTTASSKLPDPSVNSSPNKDGVVITKIFHFSSETISKLKAKANAECINCNCTNNNNNIIISSFQSLSAFLWRSITRARNLPPHQINVFMLPVNNRSKLNPPLSEDYFGNSVGIIVGGVTTTSELLQNGLGWAALKLHQAVVNYTDKEIRQWVDVWVQCPRTLNGNDRFREVEGNNNVSTLGINDFSKFNTIGNEFGLGKPLAFCSGMKGDKLSDGNMTIYSGRQPGSVDVELCLYHHTISNLQSDHDFVQFLC